MTFEMPHDIFGIGNTDVIKAPMVQPSFIYLLYLLWAKVDYEAGISAINIRRRKCCKKSVLRSFSFEVMTPKYLSS